MGMLKCEIHGVCSPVLVSEAVHNDIYNSTRDAVGVTVIDVEYFDDVIQQLYVDESFIKTIDLDKCPIHSTVFKDDVAEEILSTVRPQCAKCVGEYLSKIGLKK